MKYREQNTRLTLHHDVIYHYSINNNNSKIMQVVASTYINYINYK